MTETADIWEKSVLESIRDCKERPFGEISLDGSCAGSPFRLLFLGRDAGQKRELIDMLGRWRKANEHGFLGSFPVSYERTLAWYANHLINKPDRLLFLIEAEKKYIGHVGLFRFDFQARSCEIDNIVRGEKAFPGIMGAAILEMMRWGERTLGIKGYSLKVLGDNERAIRLYHKLGYAETGRIPLLLKPGKDGPEWTEAPAGWTGKPERYYSVMTFKGELK